MLLEAQVLMSHPVSIFNSTATDLKNFTVYSKLQDKKRRTIDYNAEVAFEKKPAAGFFDTAEETETSKMISAVSFC
jgi:hypothetical protein